MSGVHYSAGHAVWRRDESLGILNACVPVSQTAGGQWYGFVFFFLFLVGKKNRLVDFGVRKREYPGLYYESDARQMFQHTFGGDHDSTRLLIRQVRENRLLHLSLTS